MLIFVHRDSETLTLDERLGEFDTVDRREVVPVVPVRMSEAWLLFDGPAIAHAAGSPSSQVPVPNLVQIENMPDPKNRLDDLLFQAAGAPTGRRGRNFRRSIARRRVSVAEYIDTVRSRACRPFADFRERWLIATRTGTFDVEFGSELGF